MFGSVVSGKCALKVRRRERERGLTSVEVEAVKVGAFDQLPAGLRLEAGEVRLDEASVGREVARRDRSEQLLRGAQHFLLARYTSM